MGLSRFLMACGFVFLGWVEPALASTWVAGEGSDISFVARITGSSFRGTSTLTDGKVELNEAGDRVEKAFIKIKSDGFTTGMSQRDNHMNRKYIETSNFPWIWFKVEEPVDIPSDGTPLKLRGTLFFHGVKQKKTVQVKVSSRSENTMMIKGNFELDITDYGIKQPKFMVVKMEPVIKFEVHLALRKQ